MISLQSREKVHIRGARGEGWEGACTSLKMARPRLLDTSLDYKLLCHPPKLCHSGHVISCSRNDRIIKFKTHTHTHTHSHTHMLHANRFIYSAMALPGPEQTLSRKQRERRVSAKKWLVGRLLTCWVIIPSCWRSVFSL